MGRALSLGPGVPDFAPDWPGRITGFLFQERLRSFNYRTSISRFPTRYNPNLQFFHSGSLAPVIWLDNDGLSRDLSRGTQEGLGRDTAKS